MVGNPHFGESLHNTAAALLESLPPGPVSVIGHSLGGYLAMELARQAPERLHSLGLVSTQARADTSAIQARRKSLMKVVAVKGVQASLSPPALLLGAASRSDPGLWGTVEGMASNVTSSGFMRGCTAAMLRSDSRNVLQQLPTDVPVAVVVGDEDSITPLACAREIARLVPHASLTVVPGCGHLAPLEAPVQVTDALLQLQDT